MSAVWCVVGVKEEVQTLLLVCPNTEYSKNVPMVMGTNTMKLYYGHCEHAVGRNFATTLPMCSEVSFILKDLCKSDTGRLGSVRLMGTERVVPVGETVEMKGMSRAESRDSVIVQEPIEHSA